ncbi:hypothetical protein THRCLA_04475 [Thraustotheca clavata]|uniref:HMG box domain-containing protein n=1 Tax=Thraustotheca clavata TaxID=74557 RepID=A0A1V9ZYX4_9STRA|nr:hypothetical protein THRCLA_04475 [Thraustotheca clavata]
MAEIVHMEIKSDEEMDSEEVQDTPKLGNEVSIPVDPSQEETKDDDTNVAKPQSAYFHFLADKRPQVKAENPNATIGALQKILGTLWKELSAEDKEPYIQKALLDKERYAKAKERLLERGIDIEPEKPEVASEDILLLPLARVKRIIQADPDVGKISKDALIVITKATEQFIQYLAAKGQDSAMISKRKTIKDSDLLQVIHGHGSLDWLRDDFPQVSSRPSEAKVGSKGNNEAKTEAANGPRITTFFTRS